MADLATPEGVLAFLKSTPFISDSAVPLTGGTGNYVYRLLLTEPWNGNRTLVLKHGKPHLPGNKEFAFALDRQAFEVGVLRRIRKWLPEDSLVTVPAIHLFDEEANVIIMEDCGEGVKTLKQLMIDDPLSVTVARDVGTGLGEFLARLHSWGSTDEEALNYSNGNHQARMLSAFAMYGQLVPTLKGENAPASMRDPILSITDHDLEAILQIAKQTSEEMMTTRETLVMGDFWPGNILVALSSNTSRVKRIFVLDWELAKPGIAGLDVGQFLAEMHLLRRFRSHCADSSSAVMSAFQKAYGRSRAGNIEEVANKALVHIGAHLVAWTPRVDWGTREQTREVVLEGVDCLLCAGHSKVDQFNMVGELVNA